MNALKPGIITKKAASKSLNYSFRNIRTTRDSPIYLSWMEAVTLLPCDFSSTHSHLEKKNKLSLYETP